MEDKPALVDLNVQELLKEVRVDYPPDAAVEKMLSVLRSSMQEIPPHQVDASVAPSYVKELGVPQDKSKLKFKCPDSIEVIGSFGLRTMVKREQRIDIAVHIPKSCFLQKDYLSYRYHVKRALYLITLSRHLARCSFVQRMKWSFLHHDPRKPILIIQLGEDYGIGSFDICVIPIIQMEVFETPKLAISRDNVKSVSSELGYQAAPYYNSSILEDMHMLAHFSYLKTAFTESQNFRDTVLLLKVWMWQRGFTSCPDSLNNFLVSMLVAHLVTVRERRITNDMSAFQAFRLCIEALGNRKILENGLFMQQTSSRLEKGVKEMFFQHFDVVMVDPSGLLNLSFRLTKGALREIQDDACHTISAMRSVRDSGFNEIFMTPVDFSTKFDYHVRISTPDVEASTQALDQSKCKDFEGQVERLLCKGLGDRAHLIRVYRRLIASSWDIEEGPHAGRALPVYVGINVSSFEVAYRMVDVGPSADNKEEAANFRSFWGQKAELRRFKDGTINETAVWECDPSQRHHIISNIIKYVLIRHLPLACGDIYIVSGQLDFTLMEKKKDGVRLVPKLLEAFDDLSKKLRNLESVPLKVSSVQPISPAFRHSAVFPPEPHVLADETSDKRLLHDLIPTCVDPVEVMVQLEGSGRWPSNKEAIEKSKLAFSLQIAESMQRLYGVKCVAAEDCVDLLMHGFCFRLRVYYDKDPTLAQTRHEKLQHGTMDSITRTDSRTKVPVDLRHDLLLQSLHSSMLSGLQGRYPIYGPTVRLAKRWIGSHLLSDVIRDEAIELLVAHVFLKPAPYSSPLSRITGFMRFLRLMHTFTWQTSPLVIDLNEDFTQKELNFILDEFHRTRKSSSSNGQETTSEGGPAMFIATPYDLRSRTWTEQTPSYSGLKRLVAYAKTSADLLSRLMKGEVPERWPSLFRTPLKLYDILLRIYPNKLGHPARILFPPDINIPASVVVKASKDDYIAWLSPSALLHGQLDAQKHLLVGFDPTLCLIQDLKARFGVLFDYWYDSYGSGVIGLSLSSTRSQGSAKKRKRLDEMSEKHSLLIELGELGEGFIESVHASNDIC